MTFAAYNVNPATITSAGTGMRVLLHPEPTFRRACWESGVATGTACTTIETGTGNEMPKKCRKKDPHEMHAPEKAAGATERYNGYNGVDDCCPYILHKLRLIAL